MKEGTRRLFVYLLCDKCIIIGFKEITALQNSSPLFRKTGMFFFLFKLRNVNKAFEPVPRSGDPWEVLVE